MKDRMEFILELAADSSKIITDDPLSKSISEFQGDELSEYDLDEVYAAAKQDFVKFMDHINARKS